jgi:hypothetical protein
VSRIKVLTVCLGYDMHARLWVASARAPNGSVVMRMQRQTRNEAKQACRTLLEMYPKASYKAARN